MAIISEHESVVSLDFNFSNGSSGHTATITTVAYAKDLASDNEESLGSLIGLKGGRVSFTDDRLGDLLDRFRVVEKTESRDAVGLTIVRKMQDITSLRLKSNCVLVRGKHSHPKDTGSSVSVSGGTNSVTSEDLLASGGQNLRGQQYIDIEVPSNPFNQTNNSASSGTVKIPYFGEVANSPITSSSQLFPYRQNGRQGAAHLIGQIYNEESSIARDGTKVSLVYQSKKLQDGLNGLNLSFNADSVGAYYKLVPDYTNYALKYGYSLKELSSALTAAKITVVGMPQDSDVLFEEAGTLDSILSNVAAKFGYYWYINPLSGAVHFINSTSTSSYTVFNPLSDDVDVETKKTFIDASYTTSMITPRIVNAFSSTIERAETTFENDTAERHARFFKLNLVPLLSKLNIDNSLLKAFYFLYAAGKFDDSELVGAYSLLLQSISSTGGGGANGSVNLLWSYGEGGGNTHWADATLVKSYDQLEDYTSVFSDDGGTGSYADKSTLPIDLRNAKFLHLAKTNNSKKIVSPITAYPIYDKIKLIFENISNNIYISNKYGRWKATRMSWQNSPVSIEGPFKISGSKISDIDSMQNVNAVYTILGATEDNKKLSDFFDSVGEVKNNGPADGYGFIGIAPSTDKNLGALTSQSYSFNGWDSSNYAYVEVAGRTYLAVTQAFVDKVRELYRVSNSLWNYVTSSMTSGSSGRSVRVPYLRSKTTVSEDDTVLTAAEKRAAEEGDSAAKSGLDAIASYLDELSERFDERYYSLNTNGATGDDFLSPVTLDIKQGSIADIKALEADGSSSQASNAAAPVSSSRTIAGLSIPEEFSVTMSSLSIRLGSNGITTTINESTANLIQPDQQLTIDRNSQALVSRALMNRFNAAQMNYLGL